MKISSAKGSEGSDLMVLPYFSRKEKATPAAAASAYPKAAALPIRRGDFTGKHGTSCLLYAAKEPRLLLLGLGDPEELTVERLRRAYAVVAKQAQDNKCKTVSLHLPDVTSLNPFAVGRGIAEGIGLASYQFHSHKGQTKEERTLQQLLFIESNPKTLAAAREVLPILEGVAFARDLVNSNADLVTPQYLAKVAHAIAKENPKIKATLFNKARIQKEKMGLLLAVSRGSHHDPAFIILEYKGAPKKKEKTVLVGKGITFDTGGLQLKTHEGMLTMKADMGGAAAVLATIKTVAALGLHVNLTGVIPAAENSISDDSYKPGDVYTSYSGKTVEIAHTDAEGRLILADALAYSVQNLKPTRLIDFATLTGAIVVALGDEMSGLMTNDDALADQLIRSGATSGELLWRMPLHKNYLKQLDSDIADIKNTGNRYGSSIRAALFLSEFVGKTPWAHIDIAGTAYLERAFGYLSKYATGVGVRLMVDLLRDEG